jgi:uncharacterized membrane protein YGL010W
MTNSDRTTVALAPALRGHVGRYAEAHHQPTNVALHHVGIPTLAVALLGLLSRLRVRPAPDFGAIAVAGCGWWYLARDRRVGATSTSVLVACYVLGRQLPSPALAVLFGVGATLHAVGHYQFEGKPPALLSRPVAVLESPAWLVATLAGWRDEPFDDTLGAGDTPVP